MEMNLGDNLYFKLSDALDESIEIEVSEGSDSSETTGMASILFMLADVMAERGYSYADIAQLYKNVGDKLFEVDGVKPQ